MGKRQRDHLDACDDLRAKNQREGWKNCFREINKQIEKGVNRSPTPPKLVVPQLVSLKAKLTFIF